MTKAKLKQEILELFCGVGHGDVDCTIESEMKLDEILNSFVDNYETGEVEKIMNIIDGRHQQSN